MYIVCTHQETRKRESILKKGTLFQMMKKTPKNITGDHIYIYTHLTPKETEHTLQMFCDISFRVAVTCVLTADLVKNVLYILEMVG